MAPVQSRSNAYASLHRRTSNDSAPPLTPSPSRGSSTHSQTRNTRRPLTNVSSTMPDTAEGEHVSHNAHDPDINNTRLDPVTLAYYQTQLQSFNLLEPVLNPHGSAPKDVWTTIWNSELLGGEGELEEYDPEYSNVDGLINPILELEKYVADFSFSMMGDWSTGHHGETTTTDASNPSRHGGRAISGHSAHGAEVPEVLAKLDLSDFHRFMGRSGPLSSKFVVRGEQLRGQPDLSSDEGEDADGEEDEYESDHDVEADSEGSAGHASLDQQEERSLHEGNSAEQLDDDSNSEELKIRSDSGINDFSKAEHRKIAAAKGSKRTRKNAKKTKTQQFLLNKRNFPQLRACEDLIPDLFFSPDFDLTNPHTFEQLMSHLDETVGEIDEPLESKTKQTNEQASVKNTPAESDPAVPSKTKPERETMPPKSSHRSKEEWKLLRQERRRQKSAVQTEQLSFLTQYLDAVEISLLEQVRSKSQAYFTETTRFAELKTLVKEGCEQVTGLRSLLVELMLCNVEDVERIPKDAFARNALDQLSHLLELCENVVTAKASVVGLIAANDSKGAIEAIHGARELLSPSPTAAATATASSVAGDYLRNGRIYTLGKLRALSNVNNQLGEYEKIVVESLSNKLVDMFLTWHAHDFSSLEYSQFDSLSSTTNEGSNTARDLLNSLALCNKLSETNALYTERLCDIIKMTVKTTVQECLADAMLLQQQQQQQSTKPVGSIATSVTSMTFDQFMECLDMLFEQILGQVRSAVSVSKFLRQEGIVLRDAEIPDGPVRDEVNASPSASVGSSTALSVASELAHKSIAELLRIKKDAHSLLTLEQMQRLWDACLAFTVQLEKSSGTKAYGLRSTLLAQTKAFVERKHETNTTALVAALDSEKWSQCDVSAERQASLTRLCAGRAVLSTSSLSSRRLDLALDAPTTETIDATGDTSGTKASTSLASKREMTEAEVEGTNYKVVWSCLLLVEMILSDVSCAAHFQTLATNMVGKVVELLRLFNTRTSQLVLGAGAIHSSAKLKSINAKHLALVTQCLGMIIAILPHIRAALMAQLPAKQHLLLVDLDKVKQDYADHLEKVLTKFVTILGGIVEHGLSPRIAKTDFDQRAVTYSPREGEGNVAVTCCPFLDGVNTNTRKMHQVLSSLLPQEHLRDVFSRIFLYLDQKIPLLFVAAASKSTTDGAEPFFKFPTTEVGKNRMIFEVNYVLECLNTLPGVITLNFTVVSMLEKQLGVMCASEEVEMSTAIADAAVVGNDSGPSKSIFVVDRAAANGDVDETQPTVTPEEGEMDQEEESKTDVVVTVEPNPEETSKVEHHDRILMDSESQVPTERSAFANGVHDHEKDAKCNGQDNNLAEI